MTDIELIALASKASGMEFSDQNNPLERDDLALRLAVKLNMRIDHRTCSNTTYPFSVIAFPQKLEWAPKRTAELQLVSLMMPKGGFIGGLAEYCDEKYPKEPDDTTEYLDHYAATRRAVVRAAAEIGKGMKP